MVLLTLRTLLLPNQKTRIEIIADKRHAKRDEQAIRNANDIRHAMMRSKSHIRGVFNMLNDVAEREGFARLSYTEMFSINRHIISHFKVSLYLWKISA